MKNTIAMELKKEILKLKQLDAFLDAAELALKDISFVISNGYLIMEKNNKANNCKVMEF